jgi:hypothetical protein
MRVSERDLQRLKSTLLCSLETLNYEEALVYTLTGSPVQKYGGSGTPKSYV